MIFVQRAYLHLSFGYARLSDLICAFVYKFFPIARAREATFACLDD